MGGVHVADFKPRAFASQATRPQRRQTTLVSDFAQWVSLIHELAELAGAEEFAHRRRRRFSIDQIVGNHGIDFHRAHALADRPFHAQQTNAILIFQQLAHRSHPAIAQVIDVVDFAPAIFQVNQGFHHGQNVGGTQAANMIRCVQL